MLRLPVFITILIAALILSPQISLSSETLKKIEIQGNERISDSTILIYLKLQEGEKYTQTEIDSSIKELFGTGFFTNITIFPKKSNPQILVVDVEENPLINKVYFEGNKRIKDKILSKEISSVKGITYSLYKVRNDIKKISKLYQRRGRYAAKIEPKIVKLEQNRVNLVYEIIEGTKAKIRNIVFVGNNAFSDRELKKVIFSKEDAWYRFFSSADVYDPDKIMFDKELLRRHYMQEGYADFKINSFAAEISPAMDSLMLTFMVQEGEKYSFGDVSIESKIDEIDASELEKLIEIQKGDTFDERMIEQTIDKITEELGKKGYVFVDVEQDIKKDFENKILNLKLIVNETNKVYINKINIKNNVRTLDKVIRREFRVDEGDAYNATKVRRSKQRINNLGYFSSVKFKNVKTGYKDKVDIDVDIQETSTGHVNFAVGYNTSVGAIGSIGLSENNLLGKGQQIELEVQRAKKSADISFGFTEPYFMDMDLSAGFDVFKATRDNKSESSYSSDVRGFGLRFGYELTEYLYHGFRYSLKNEKVTGVSKTASVFVKNQVGKRTVSSIGQTFTYDKLDNFIDPSKGYVLRFSQDFAGLGGEAKYIQHQISGSTYRPIYKKDFILGLTVRAGHIKGFGKKGMRINDRFFLGSEYIRGFENAGIGPRDKKTRDALGGTTYYSGTAEVMFPLGLPEELRIKGSVFTDFGTLLGIDGLTNQTGVDKSCIYNKSSIRASYGAGVLWKSPIGNIRLDYGVPFRKESFDKKENIRFSFGSAF